MSRMKIYKVLLAVEMVILSVFGVMLVVQWKGNKDVTLPLADWKSDYIAYDDSYGWYVDEKLLDTNEKVDLICGPDIRLKKGTYNIKVTYHCDFDQSCMAYTNDGPDFQLKTGEIALSRNQDYLSYEIEVGEDFQNFGLVFRYNGKGYFQIANITIAPNSTGMLRGSSIVFALFICLDLCILFADRIKKDKETILAMLGIVLLVSLPIFTDGIAKGHDLAFHLMRIEGIAKEIRLGNLPVRLSSYFMDGYGYPASIYYGDILLYIPAVLRLIGFSVTGVYKFYIFMINVGTVMIAYFCMKSIFKDKRIALLTCLAYCSSTYRLVNIYERAAVGEYSAMMFMPIVAVAVYKIYTDDLADGRAYKKNALLLAIGMSGLVGTHILSTEMVILTLAVICISLLKLTFRKSTLKVYLLAVLETCAFSAYFTVPFLDYLINVPTKIGALVSEGGGKNPKVGYNI